MPVHQIFVAKESGKANSLDVSCGAFLEDTVQQVDVLDVELATRRAGCGGLNGEKKSERKQRS